MGGTDYWNYTMVGINNNKLLISFKIIWYSVLNLSELINILFNFYPVKCNLYS